MKPLSFAGLVATGSILASSCYVNDEPTPRAMTPAAGPRVLTREQAATALAEARCDHEAKCNAIGPTGQFANRDQCMNNLGNDSWQGIANCTYGVKDRELGACVTEIRNQACGGLLNPIDWFSKVVTCRTNNICLH